MSRKKIWISIIITSLMVLYFGYESLSLDNITLVSDFLESYLNTPQKYIFNGMIYGVPLIYLSAIRFCIPEYAVRQKSNLLGYITSKCLKVALSISGFVVILHILSALIFGIAIDVNIIVAVVYIRMAIFYTQCSFLYYLTYTISNSPIISIAITTGTNMLFLSALLMYDFVVDPLNNIALNIFIIYECVTCVLAYAGFCISIKNKEYL